MQQIVMEKANSLYKLQKHFYKNVLFLKTNKTPFGDGENIK